MTPLHAALVLAAKKGIQVTFRGTRKFELFFMLDHGKCPPVRVFTVPIEEIEKEGDALGEAVLRAVEAFPTRRDLLPRSEASSN
jgi:hypothetical protein